MLTTASLEVSRQILHSNVLFVLDSSSLSLVEVLLDVLDVAISFMERRKVLIDYSLPLCNKPSVG